MRTAICLIVAIIWVTLIWGPQPRYETINMGEGVFVRVNVDTGDVCLTSMELGEWVCAEELRAFADRIEGGTTAEEELWF